MENLLTPDYVRRAMWSPPSTRDPVELLERMIDLLSRLGARSWQIGLTASALAEAVLEADRSAPKKPFPKRKAAGDGTDGDADDDLAGDDVALPDVDDPEL